MTCDEDVDDVIVGDVSGETLDDVSGDEAVGDIGDCGVCLAPILLLVVYRCASGGGFLTSGDSTLMLAVSDSIACMVFCRRPL